MHVYPAAGLPGFAQQFHIRNGRDTCKSLAAKAERSDTIQVLAASDFAGSVFVKCDDRIIRFEAAAVIRNANIFDAACANFHMDCAGSCID